MPDGAAIQQGPPGPLNLALSNVDALITDLGKVTASGGVQQPEATKVQIVSGADSVLAIVKNSLTPVAGPIGEFALVVVLVVFMLLERKRLRVRFLRLIGHSRVATTNLAVDEVGSKLSRFLLGQLLVNTGYALLLLARAFSDRYTKRPALGSSDIGIAVFALRRPMDIGLFPVAIIYCHFHQLEGADTDSGPLRVSGSVH